MKESIKKWGHQIRKACEVSAPHRRTSAVAPRILCSPGSPVGACGRRTRETRHECHRNENTRQGFIRSRARGGSWPRRTPALWSLAGGHLGRSPGPEHEPHDPCRSRVSRGEEAADQGDGPAEDRPKSMRTQRSARSSPLVSHRLSSTRSSGSSGSPRSSRPRVSSPTLSGPVPFERPRGGRRRAPLRAPPRSP